MMKSHLIALEYIQDKNVLKQIFRLKMADKELKAFLKEAKEQIKAKEFKSALKEVKKVLNKDKNNYMGLVFCGLCLSELDQPDQALQAYRKATESNPDQPTAWEGLAKFFEKYAAKEEYMKDRICCLQKLLDFHKVSMKHDFRCIV